MSNYEGKHQGLLRGIKQAMPADGLFPSLDDNENRREEQIRAMMNALRLLGEGSEDGALSIRLAQELEAFMGDGSKSPQGVSEQFLDSLERIDKKLLRKDETCPICTNDFLSDEYPLVVRLNNCSHRFDLDCIKPWLTINSTCPLCRSDVLAKKEIELPSDDEEEFDDMYG